MRSCACCTSTARSLTSGRRACSSTCKYSQPWPTGGWFLNHEGLAGLAWLPSSVCVGCVCNSALLALAHRLPCRARNSCAALATAPTTSAMRWDRWQPSTACGSPPPQRNSRKCPTGERQCCVYAKAPVELCSGGRPQAGRLPSQAEEHCSGIPWAPAQRAAAAVLRPAGFWCWAAPALWLASRHSATKSCLWW